MKYQNTLTKMIECIYNYLLLQLLQNNIYLYIYLSEI